MVIVIIRVSNGICFDCKVRNLSIIRVRLWGLVIVDRNIGWYRVVSSRLIIVVLMLVIVLVMVGWVVRVC